MEKNISAIEIERIHAEIGKLIAETAKLNNESAKMARERWWYPVFIAGTIMGATAAIVKVFFT